MIDQIKNIKSEILMAIIDNYEKLLEQKDELTTLSRDFTSRYYSFDYPLIPYQKFNWFEKHIFKRKQFQKWQEDYNKNQYEINRNKQELKEKMDEAEKKLQAINEKIKESEEKVKKAREELEVIQNSKTLKDLGLSFKQAVEILQKEGIPIVLTEEDKAIAESDTIYSSIDDFILVHKTRFYPTDSKIKTSLSKKAGKSIEVTIGKKTINIPYRSYRDTIHFSVNGEVGDHVYGSWDDCEYAVLIPMKSCKLDQIGSAPPQDTFLNGDVELPDDAWILCPKGKKDEIQNVNPNVQIMEYEGDCVTDYADTLVSLLGYRVEEVGMHSWQNGTSVEQYFDVMRREGFTNFMPHGSCKEFLEETSRGALGNFIIETQAIQEQFSKEEFADNKNAIFYFVQAGVRDVLNNYFLDNGKRPSIEEIIELLKKELKSLGIELTEDVLDSEAITDVKNSSNYYFESDRRTEGFAPIIADAVLTGMEISKSKELSGQQETKITDSNDEVR